MTENISYADVSRRNQNELHALQSGILPSNQAQSVKPEDKRSPAGVQLRLKIFPYFLKSREAANFFPGSVQVATIDSSRLFRCHFTVKIIV